MMGSERDELRLLAQRAADSRPGPWEIQTSNSFRRIGTPHGDGNVLCATVHPRDRHPDLLVTADVLQYLVAVQPRVVLELLDQLDAVEAAVRGEGL